jgi:hypothetical protein
MKRVFTLAILLLLYGTSIAQGNYAGTKKTLIGKWFTDYNDIAGLKGWTFMEGGLANSLDDPERIMSNVFKKGTSYVVLFSIMEDTASGKYKIFDVLEITAVQKGWTIRSSFCRQNEQESNYIVAWGKESTEPYMTIIKKAWKFNPDKRRFEAILIKGIDCENIGC